MVIATIIHGNDDKNVYFVVISKKRGFMNHKKFNQLVKMGHSFTAFQHKGLNSLLHSLREQFKNDYSSGNRTFVIDYTQLTSASVDTTARKQICDQLEDLSCKLIVYLTSENGRRRTVITAIEKLDHVKGTTTADVLLTGSFIDLCKGFYDAGGFLKVPVDETKNLKGKHSLQLYEHLKLYAENGRSSINIELSELREFLGIEPSQYTRFSDFKRRVLDGSHSEIHEKTGLVYKMNVVKRGVRVSAIEFYEIAYKAQKSHIKAVEPHKRSETTTAVEKLFLEYGMGSSEAKDLSERYRDCEIVKECIKRAKQAKYVENPRAYLKIVLKNEYFDLEATFETQRKAKTESDKKAAMKDAQRTTEIAESTESMETLKNEIKALPKSVVELVESQYMKNGGNIFGDSLMLVYPQLKNRINYDAENDIATLQEELI